MLRGIVTKVVPCGLVYVRKEGTTELLAFTFGKIFGYRGESARELGLCVGSSVRFDGGDSNTITRVELD